MKFKNQNSHSIQDHFTRFKYQQNQHTRNYNKHSMDFRMVKVEFLPILKQNEKQCGFGPLSLKLML